jgi:Flp pilus assembly protein TadD
MSLINQMLKDLETRRAEGGSAQHATLVRPRSGFLPWIVAGTLGLVAVVLGVLLWQQNTPVETHAVAEQQQAPVEAGRSVTGADATLVTERETDTDTDANTHQDLQQPADTSTLAATETGTGNVETPEPTTRDDKLEPDSDEPAVAVTTPEPVAADPTSDKPVVTEPVETRQQDSNAGTDGSFSITPSTADPREQAKRNIERGLDAARRGEHRRASEHLQAGLAILPREDEARMALHASLRRQGRIAEAEGILEAGLVDAREPYRFAAVLARLRAQRGNLDEAVAFLKLDPPAVQADPEYHALWGALLQQQGDYSAALPVYARLVDYQPGNAQWLAGLGIARQQTGDAQGAIDAYERALRTGRLADTLTDYIQDQLNTLAPEEN